MSAVRSPIGCQLAWPKRRGDDRGRARVRASTRSASPPRGAAARRWIASTQSAAEAWEPRGAAAGPLRRGLPLVLRGEPAPGDGLRAARGSAGRLPGGADRGALRPRARPCEWPCRWTCRRTRRWPREGLLKRTVWPRARAGQGPTTTARRTRPVHVGEANVAAGVAIGEPLVVEARRGGGRWPRGRRRRRGSSTA